MSRKQAGRYLDTALCWPVDHRKRHKCSHIYLSHDGPSTAPSQHHKTTVSQLSLSRYRTCSSYTDAMINIRRLTEASLSKDHPSVPLLRPLHISFFIWSCVVQAWRFVLGCWFFFPPFLLSYTPPVGFVCNTTLPSADLSLSRILLFYVHWR
ncbi:hypothetical protein F4825DRAFT_84017 [Nemania diffusa]|nr:hypothetical protein F4825DRAFT_84017 [Nemania diffusa]